MRNVFYFLAAILAFGAAWYYYQDVSEQTATIRKLRLVTEDNLTIKSGTVVDDAFMDKYVVSQEMPRSLADQFTWALDDNAATRINLRDRVFGQDIPAGSFLQRAHFFVAQEKAFARRIRKGNRAFSIPVQSQHTLENFIEPGARVDVVGTFEQSDGDYFSKLLLENVEVMAVGSIDNRGEYASQDRPSYSSVTLQASAAAVEAFLGDAESSDGAMTLVLRNPCEDTDACIGNTVASE